MPKVTNSSHLNRETIQKILRDHFQDPKLEVTEAQDKGNFVGENDNFASDITSWDVSVVFGGGDQKQISFVVKNPSESPFFKSLSTIWRPFAKEIFWFRSAYPTLSTLCPEIQDISPACYYGYSNYEGSLFRSKGIFDQTKLIMLQMMLSKKESGILVLENLKHRNPAMKMLDKKKIMTVNQVRVVFQTLARLHGSFLKWEHSPEGKNFKGIREKDLEGLYLVTNPWFLKNSAKITTNAISSLLLHAGKTDLQERWLKYAKSNLLKRNSEIATTHLEKEKSSIVTLCHGDTWTNNMMFSEDETKVALLDYQLMCILHPAKDLWYFLSLATDAQFRREHLNGLLRDYFEVFESYLDSTNICITFDQFKSEFEERRDLLLSVGAELMPTVLSTEKLQLTDWRSLQVIGGKRAEAIGGVPKPDDLPMTVEIRRRLVATIQEAVDCGFI